jgi:hypothetical protein
MYDLGSCILLRVNVVMMLKQVSNSQNRDYKLDQNLYGRITNIEM